MSETDLASTQPPENPGRRRLLTWTTGVVGAVGAGLAIWPFAASWKPSAKARLIGAPVEVNVANLEPGQIMKVQWRGSTIGIMRRNERMIEDLPEINERLADPQSEVATQQPEYAQNVHRSIKPEFLVANIHCTHLGCIPTFLPEVEAQPFDADWRGGFFCPCHRSKFDLAGRVYAGVPAQLNLVIPPYHFVDDNTVMIGEGPKAEGAA
ncbi:MAG: ubiquinol-cytochrome c reductase iron-sulfur subunit [Wenzhouxiangella sp.]|jgi:ubiquinol-cytochrome c reductase iron-sulfur subunit|nr:ubiquinol-cytochrome c reductase iron-sulfur subunit [Wenzhouxiangella sp.]